MCALLAFVFFFAFGSYAVASLLGLPPEIALLIVIGGFFAFVIVFVIVDVLRN